MEAIDSKRFTVSGKILVAEASDLRDAGFEIGQTPVKLAVQSARTGRVVQFSLEGVDRDGEGDVWCWRYAPVATSDPASQLVGVRVHVYND